MLSPSSLSSTSIGQDDLSNNTLLSTSFIVASESSSNSSCISDLNHHKFKAFQQHANSTPLIGGSANTSTYENDSVPYSIASTSDDSPLFIVNPCYQSTPINNSYMFNQQHDGTNNFYGNPNALRSLQNIHPPHSPTTPITAAPDMPSRNLSAKRTISLQMVRPFQSFDNDNRSGANILSPALSNSSSNQSPQLLNHANNRRSSNHHNYPLCGQQQQPQQHIYICNQSVAVVNWLNEKSLCHLTKLFQIHSTTQSTSRWLLQMRHLRYFVLQIRAKTQNIDGNKNRRESANIPEYNLYKMPLATVQANTKDCSPLPQFVHDIMDYITGQADLAEGIFRKSGSKKRIDEIKDICARLLPHQRIPLHLLDNSQVHDLGDSLKRYFRELPECILTNRLSKMIENIVSELPNTNDEHFTALHYCILLLPSENREGLMILLRFLKGIARHSPSNEMTASNLATCWMPSLFRFSQEDKEIADKNGIGHKNGGRKLTRRKTIGIPNDKERNAYEAIKRLLAKMIEDWEKLTGLPQSMVPEIAKNGLKICHDLGVPIKNGQFDFTEELHLNFRRQLFRLKEDYFAGWKNWSLQRVFTDGSQIFTREINDMIPLKCFRIQTSISAPPNLILMAILYGRNFWDSNVTGWKRIGPSGQNFDIIKLQYRRDLLDPKDKHSFLARRWSYSEFDHDSICSLIECSVVPRGQDKQNVVGSNVSVYESKFLIREICPGHSQLTYISRLDFKGRSSQWYDRVYGEMLVNQIKRLKQNLFKYNISSTKGTIV